MLAHRIETLLNRQVAASPRAQALLLQLEGRGVAVELSHSTLALALRSDGQRLRLSRAATGSPSDAVIRGSALSLASLAGASPEAVIRSGAVQIEGDTEVATRFRELSQLLRPDLEEELSRLIGDVAAYQAGALARRAGAWLRRGVATAGANLAEYLAHERGDLVPRAESGSFFAEVDALRERADRLAARIALLPGVVQSP